MHTVGFRLSRRHLQMLEQGAASLSMSVHEYARHRLIADLENTDIERLQFEIAELKEELLTHREEFATAVKALLDAVHDPRRATPERVQEWVQENLRT